MKAARSILHLDLQGFFVSVHRSLDPALRGRPVIVGGRDEMSLVAAASPDVMERGVRPVHSDEGPGGYEWSSDPRLTLPTMTRMTEPQVEDLVAGIECPVRAIFAEPAQPYLPDDLRRRRVALLPRGELIVIPGGHHLHMQQPAEVAAAIGDFFEG